MNSEQESPEPSSQVEVATRLASKFGWLGPASSLSAAVTSFWLIYLVFRDRGFLAAFFAFLLLSVCYMFGPAPMFAVASSFLCFYFHAIGFWLPILSYIVAAITLIVSIQIDRARKAVDPSSVESP
jgi:hypothetical protein